MKKIVFCNCLKYKGTALIFLYFILVYLVSCTPGKKGEILLQNRQASLVFGESANGALLSYTGHKSGIEFIAAQSSPQLFNLGVSRKSDPGGNLIQLSSLDAENFETARKKGAVTLNYKDLGKLGIGVKCTAVTSKTDGSVRWRLAVTIPDSLVLEEVQFPIVLMPAPLAGDGSDDAAVFGHTKGGVIRNPSALKTGTRISGKQPGSLTAQFGCYYDSKAGFYTAVHDSTGHPKTFEILRTGEGVQLSWNFHVYREKEYAMDFDVVTSLFSSPDTSIPTDWRHAADIYKKWAVQQKWCKTLYSDRKDIPEWMKQGPALVRFTRDWLSEPPQIVHWLENYWKKNFPDIPLITAYWGWEKVHYWITPDYFPVYPSNEQFSDLVAKSRELGCHAFPWPSGYHWTLMFDKKDDGTFSWDDRKRFDETVRHHAIHKRDGELYIRVPFWLKGGETACMCPGDPWTIDWWNKDICEPLTRMGCELIQVDQVVGGNFPFCYKRDHPHPPGPGPWMTEVFTRQLETMFESMRKIEPEATVCYEEPNELFNHLASIQDYRDCESRQEWASVFNYLYHEYLPTFQSNPKADDNVITAYCLVTGQMPHMKPSAQDTAAAVPSPETDFVQRWIRLYHGEGRAWLQFGKTCHPPRLTCNEMDYKEKKVPVIFHNAFISADGKEAIVLANATRENQTARLVWKDKETTLELKPLEIGFYTNDTLP